MNTSSDAGWGIPAYAGMTGWKAGMAGWGREWWNAKAQGRNEKQARDSRLRGNDGCVGMTGRGWEWWNAKAQGRNEKQARDSRLRGNDGCVGMTGRGAGRDMCGVKENGLSRARLRSERGMSWWDGDPTAIPRLHSLGSLRLPCSEECESRTRASLPHRPRSIHTFR